MSEETPEPFSKLAESAVQMHEWFGSLIEAGFTEEQALTLMAKIVMQARGDS